MENARIFQDIQGTFNKGYLTSVIWTNYAFENQVHVDWTIQAAEFLQKVVRIYGTFDNNYKWISE